MNFGLLLRTEIARFTRLLGSISVTISPGRLITPIFNAKAVQIPFFGRIFINGSVQRIDVSRPFFKSGVATVAWTENLYFKPCCYFDSLVRSPDNPINMRAVTRRIRDDFLNTNRVERFQTLS